MSAAATLAPTLHSAIHLNCGRPVDRSRFELFYRKLDIAVQKYFNIGSLLGVIETESLK